MRKLCFNLSIAVWTISQQVLACPGCKDALSQKGASTNAWGAAFNLSILFMLGTVLTIVGMVVFFIRRLVQAEEAGHVQIAPAMPRRKLPLKVIFPILAVLYLGLCSWATVRALAASDPKAPEPLMSISSGYTDETFHSAISAPTVLVDFGAPWCTYCLKTAPAFKQLSQDNASRAVCVYVNVDQCPKTAQAYNIDELPCIVLFANGKEVARHTGVATYPELQQWLATHASSMASSQYRLK